MARATFVKSARKAIKGTGIKKGDSYYWWKFRYGDKQVSKTPPRRSQLTQSDFLGQLYDLEDQLADLVADNYLDDPSALKDDIQQIADDVRALGGEQADKLSNMPDSLQQGPTGEMLQSRADGCDAWADELEAVDVEEADEKGEDETDEQYQERVREVVWAAIDWANSTSYSGD